MDAEFEQLKQIFRGDIEKLLGKESATKYEQKVFKAVEGLQIKYSRRLTSQEQGEVVVTVAGKFLEPEYSFKTKVENGMFVGYEILKGNEAVSDKNLEHLWKK